MGSDHPIVLGVLATIGTGLATGVGALPVLFTWNVSDHLLDGMLGFAAGVMLAATAFSLLVPAVELGGVWVTIAGVMAGALFLDAADRMIPHVHFVSGSKGPSSTWRRVWLLILAITLHNFPNLCQRKDECVHFVYICRRKGRSWNTCH